MEVTFILNTNAEILAAWLMENWRTPYGASEGGSLQGQRLGRKNRPYETKGPITLSADVMLVSKPNDEGVQVAHPLRDAFEFVLQPLAAERVEVTARYQFHYALLADLARLLEEMARRWPELRDTLEYRPGFWYFDDHLWVENETQQKLLDAFTERLRRLKIKPGQRTQMYGHPIVGTPIAPMISPTNPAVERRKPPAPALALQSKYSCGAVFYVDNTTAREVCNWLTENWRRRDREPANVWTWPTDYHHGRRYRTTPLREATDGAGRVLLAVGIEEWETTHPAPLSVFMGPLNIQSDQFTQVQDNPRALEILIIQAGADLVQVEARCNAVLLLGSFTQLLRAAKVAYGGRLRNIAPTFSRMDAAPPGDAMMDAYIAARLEEFQELVIYLEPRFANAFGKPTRDDGAAQPETPASEAARDDGPAAVIGGGHGAVNAGAGKLIVGTAIGGSGRGAHGVVNQGPGTAHVGTAIAGSGYDAHGAVNRGPGLLHVDTALVDGEGATAPASEPASEAARDDGPDPDSIPRWGTRRDLSTHEVRTIVKRCNQHRQLPGGSIAKFHEQESRKWPEPDDAPKSYSLKTLQKWMNDARFQ